MEDTVLVETRLKMDLRRYPVKYGAVTIGAVSHLMEEEVSYEDQENFIRHTMHDKVSVRNPKVAVRLHFNNDDTGFNYELSESDLREYFNETVSTSMLNAFGHFMEHVRSKALAQIQLGDPKIISLEGDCARTDIKVWM